MKQTIIIPIFAFAIFLGILFSGNQDMSFLKMPDISDCLSPPEEYNYTGFVTDVEFIYPSTTLIKFDNKTALAFDGYLYRERFPNKLRPLYRLDNYTVNN